MSCVKPSRNCHFGDASGASAIEFAILAPVFLLMLFGMIAYAIYFGAAHSVQQIAADAARTSIAGLDEAERNALVSTYVERNAGDYPLIVRDHLTYAIADKEGDASQYEVTVGYDASALPIGNLPPRSPCPRPPAGRPIPARPGIARLFIGDTHGTTGMGTLPTVAHATVVDALLLEVTARSVVDIGQTAPVNLSFSSADIGTQSIKTASTTIIVGSLAASLIDDMDLDIRILGLGLGTRELIGNTIRSLLLPLAPLLDQILDDVDGDRSADLDRSSWSRSP